MTNKSIVRNTFSRSFFSNNGFASVVEPKDLSTHFCPAMGRNVSIVPITEITGDSEFNNITNSSCYALVPHTVPVYDNKKHIVILELPSKRFALTTDHTINDSNIRNNRKVYVSRLQPTNINYNSVSAVVYGDYIERGEVQLSGASVNINSKFEVVIPQFSTYGNMSLTVQKNCFIELQLSDNVIDVVKLPSELVYDSGYIKGTFTKSGLYTIIIDYPDGQQILNIEVPYYQRLL